ncbi:heat-inducible transcriptional repressor HrcA [Hyphococcus sp.]|uniref:heat-inducible transcriptional repressor HrcA n=1 Tax=Hyphococcus sp. TaxID=2038636 RepID=UPI0020801494|nr:MAG: heat-inducible transcription repressor HrcA [Marinicaulis sp.]
MTELGDIDERSREIFRRLVETYLATGEPVGSRTLSHNSQIAVSAATVRNVMADLTDMGLLHSPHISAGRLPTELGLRLFVDGMMQVGDLTAEERRAIEAETRADSADSLLEMAAARLSGLTQTASLIVAQKSDAPLRQIEFVRTGTGKALVVMVFEDGRVENRIIDAPDDLPPSALIAAGNYLNARLRGRSLSDTRAKIIAEIESNRAELDELTSRLVRDGVADVAGDENWQLIVRGRGHLLDESAQDIERVRMLLDDLERKRDVIELLTAARDGEGVKVFIGSENRLFSLSGSSVITAPYRDESRKIVGILGVIGPTRLNYARVVPIVDYTAEVLSRMLK